MFSAAREIWLAARSGGFHFAWDGSHWTSARNGEELQAAVARCLTEQTGVKVSLG